MRREQRVVGGGHLYERRKKGLGRGVGGEREKKGRRGTAALVKRTKKRGKIFLFGIGKVLLEKGNRV